VGQSWWSEAHLNGFIARVTQLLEGSVVEFGSDVLNSDDSTVAFVVRSKNIGHLPVTATVRGHIKVTAWTLLLHNQHHLNPAMGPCCRHAAFASLTSVPTHPSKWCWTPVWATLRGCCPVLSGAGRPAVPLARPAAGCGAPLLHPALPAPRARPGGPAEAQPLPLAPHRRPGGLDDSQTWERHTRAEGALWLRHMGG